MAPRVGEAVCTTASAAWNTQWKALLPSIRTPVSSEATTAARRSVDTAFSRPERKRPCARWSRFISPPWLRVRPNSSESAACSRSYESA